MIYGALLYKSFHIPFRPLCSQFITLFQHNFGWCAVVRSPEDNCSHRSCLKGKKTTSLLGLSQTPLRSPDPVHSQRSEKRKRSTRSVGLEAEACRCLVITTAESMGPYNCVASARQQNLFAKKSQSYVLLSVLGTPDLLDQFYFQFQRSYSEPPEC